MNASSSKKPRRQRSRNTSLEQYNIYLSFMENDYYFRSNTINPAIGANYLDIKWKELTNLLNSAGDGPQLATEEWKKRFIDWKYAVRQKYRKIVDERKKTGSGPCSDIKLNPVEERGLSVWGKVVVTGSPQVITFDGLPSEELNKPENRIPEGIPENEEDIIIEFIPSDIDKDILNKESLCFSENSKENIQPNIIQTPSKSKQNLKSKVKQKTPTRMKPLSLLTEQLLQSNKQCVENSLVLNKTLDTFCQQYIEVEKFKLKFEVAKFKFQNPEFKFDLFQ